MTAIGLYPGCSLNGSSREYNESVQAVAEAAGLELREIPDWNCCGATSAHNLNKELSLALPARILANAEAAGMSEILVPCAACYSRLSVTQHELSEKKELRDRITSLIQSEYSGRVTILNVIQMLEKYVYPNMDNLITKPFAHKVACYYGCLLVRPHGILKFDRLEDPRSMDKLMEKIGATPIEWPFKTECCGAGFSVSNTEIVGRLSGNILKDASDRNAEVIVVACPMCHSNLDMRRPDINKHLQEKIGIPVIYITQAIGLAMGIEAKKLGLHRHFVPAMTL
jgi:heterodisulfide reductase subunit B2